MQHQTLLMLCWRSSSEWGKECVTFSFTFKGSLYLIYDRLHPIASQITQDARRKIIDSPFSVISRMGQGPFLTCFRLSRRPMNPKRTTIYQCQYVAISNRISEGNYTLKYPKTGTGDWNWRVWWNPVKPAGWRVRVRASPTNMPWVRSLHGIGTKPNRFSGPNPDRWWVTWTRC